MTLRARCNRAVLPLALVTLSIIPATLPAQRVAMARAGIAPARVELAPRERADTARRDSAARSRGRHVLIGAASGLAAGAVVGSAAAAYAKGRCAPNDDMCGLNGLLVPFYAVIGLLAGTIAGALWPTH